MAESNVQIKPNVFFKKDQSDLFEDVVSQRVSRPNTGYSSNYPEYDCQPDRMIKEFFPVDTANNKSIQSASTNIMVINTQEKSLNLFVCFVRKQQAQTI